MDDKTRQITTDPSSSAPDPPQGESAVGKYETCQCERSPTLFPSRSDETLKSDEIWTSHRYLQAETHLWRSQPSLSGRSARFPAPNINQTHQNGLDDPQPDRSEGRYEVLILG